MRDFKNRSDETELMDDLSCGGEVIDQTLRELDIINRRLGGNYVSLQGLKELTNDTHKKQEIVVADLGCGGGDILIGMAKWAKKNGFTMRFTGFDANENIIKYAQNHCKDYPEISFKCMDIFSKEFQEMEFDIVHSSLFTHHFTDDELIGIVKGLKQRVKLGIVINDLHRHWLAYYSIKLLTRLFSNSEMVAHDAAISVARGFKKPELTHIFTQSGLKNVSVKWRWAFRWKIVSQLS